MTRDEWLTAFAARLEIDPPDEDTVEQLLALAASAAHQSERTAAPVACWLAGVAGVSPADAARAAADLAPDGSGA